jgi:hypothetical protein
MFAVMRVSTAWIGCCLALLSCTLAAPVLHAQNHKDLIELPLSRIDGAEYYLFFNALHPKAKYYTDIVAASMAAMKESRNGIENRER